MNRSNFLKSIVSAFFSFPLIKFLEDNETITISESGMYDISAPYDLIIAKENKFMFWNDVMDIHIEAWQKDLIDYIEEHKVPKITYDFDKNKFKIK